MGSELELANDMLIKGISLIGKARIKHRLSPVEAVSILHYAISTINSSIDMAPTDIGNRKERLKHFLGVSMNSPVDLSKTIELDLQFFTERYYDLTMAEKSFVKFISGQYLIFHGNIDQGLNLLAECIGLCPDSLEAMEAKITIDSIKKY